MLLLNTGNLVSYQQDSYRITGNVKNLPAKSVFIRVMKRDPRDNHIFWPKIDSAKVINGSFILHKDSTLTEPAWSSSISYIDTNTKKEVALKFLNPYSSKTHVNFILENAEISVVGDASSKTGVSITGSKETDFNFKYGLIYPTYIFEWEPKIDSLRKKGDVIKLNEAIRLKKEMAAKFKDDFRTIILNNATTHQSLVNLYQNIKLFTPEELEELIELFNPRLLTTAHGTKVLTYIKQSKLLLQSKIFPDFVYNDQFRKKTSLKEVTGKNGTIVIFWASWCGPCRQEIPHLKKLYEKYHPLGINMVSISVDYNSDNWKKALTVEKMPWINLSNLPGDHREIATKYNINSIPSIFVIDKNNRIVLADADFPQVEAQAKLLVNN